MKKYIKIFIKKYIHSVFLFAMLLIVSVFIAWFASALIIFNNRVDLIKQVMDNDDEDRERYSDEDFIYFTIYLTSEYTKLGSVWTWDDSFDGWIYIDNINGHEAFELTEDEKNSYEVETSLDVSFTSLIGISKSRTKKEIVSESPNYSVQIKVKELGSNREEELIYFPGDYIYLNFDKDSAYSIYAKLPPDSYPHLGFMSLNMPTKITITDTHVPIDEDDLSFFNWP